jgi:hypothetical protein
MQRRQGTHVHRSTLNQPSIQITPELSFIAKGFRNNRDGSLCAVASHWLTEHSALQSKRVSAGNTKMGVFFHMPELRHDYRNSPQGSLAAEKDNSQLPTT